MQKMKATNPHGPTAVICLGATLRRVSLRNIYFDNAAIMNAIQSDEYYEGGVEIVEMG
jgi:hypothetical protein